MDVNSPPMPLPLFWGKEIKHLRLSVNYPRANGAIERFNRVLKECSQTADKMHKPWKQTVVPHRSYTIQVTENQENAHKTKPSQMEERVKQKQQKSKEDTDRKVGAKVPRFKVNDTVRVRRPTTIRRDHPDSQNPWLWLRKWDQTFQTHPS